MTKNTTDNVGINKEPYKQPPYAYDAVQITITPDERKYLVDIAVVMSKLRVKRLILPFYLIRPWLVLGRWR